MDIMIKARSITLTHKLFMSDGTSHIVPIINEAMPQM